MTTTTPFPSAGLAADALSSAVRLDRFARPAPHSDLRADGRPPRMMPLMRKFEVACLLPDGRITEFNRLVPAIPAFEDAAAAFSRNTLVTTGRGLMAVGDIWPGDMIRTATNGFQPLLWKGATMLVPEARGQDAAMGRLTRIAGDSFGIARPMPDLVLGPRARLTHRAPGIAALTGSEAALIPARDFIDGVSVIELTPATPVQVYHLGFAGHERVLAHGVEVESLHPGPIHQLGLRGEMLSLYLSCFPHVGDLADFGPLGLPRLRLMDLDLFNVA